jgi:hypothetical protein
VRDVEAGAEADLAHIARQPRRHPAADSAEVAACESYVGNARQNLVPAEANDAGMPIAISLACGPAAATSRLGRGACLPAAHP